MKTHRFIELMVWVGASLIATSAFAGSSFQGEYDFLNPGGCRGFDRVVDPNCPYDAARNACSAVQGVLSQVATQNPSLGLKADCDTLHTGNFFARMLDELMMNSPSFDGYKLEMKVNGDSELNTPGLQTTTAAADAAICEDAARALLKLNQQDLEVSAYCDGNELRASFQF